MDEITLIDRLGALQPPEPELAKSRALAAVPARVQAARAGRDDRTRRFWPRLATVAAVGLVVLVSCSLLTSPGKAFTTWVGDRLGLGEPGGPPALESLHRHAMMGTSGEGQPAYVLLRGPGPLGGHYEFITYRTPPETGGQSPTDDTRCFQLEFPEAGNLFQAGCGLPPADDGLLFEGVGGNSAPGRSYQFASGRVSENVASVEFEVDGRTFPVELRSVPADLIERFDFPRSFKFFIVFLDRDLRAGKVTVTARDAAGDQVASDTSTLLGASVIQP